MLKKLMMVSLAILIISSIVIISPSFLAVLDQTSTAKQGTQDNPPISASTFSRGITLKVTVNTTNPSMGNVVDISEVVINVNSTEKVFLSSRLFNTTIVNHDGKKVYAFYTVIPGPKPEFTLGASQQGGTTRWKVGTDPIHNVEVRRGETYYIIVTCMLNTATMETIELSTEPIGVTVK